MTTGPACLASLGVNFGIGFLHEFEHRNSRATTFDTAMTPTPPPHQPLGPPEGHRPVVALPSPAPQELVPAAHHAIFPLPSSPENLPSEVDLALLQAFSRQPKASTSVLAEEVGIKPNEVRERLARLFGDGSLLGIRAIVTPFEVPLDSVKMFCHIRLTSRLASVRQRFTTVVHDDSRIVRCLQVSADFDYLLQIVVTDMPSCRSLISGLPHVAQIKVVSVLNEPS